MLTLLHIGFINYTKVSEEINLYLPVFLTSLVTQQDLSSPDQRHNDFSQMHVQVEGAVSVRMRFVHVLVFCTRA